MFCIAFYILIFFVVKNSLNWQKIDKIYENKFINNIIHNSENDYTDISNEIQIENQENISTNKTMDWRLILVNYQNPLSDDFEVNLSYIDDTRRFDSRAIDELNQMLKDMKSKGLSNIWVQSSYKSIKYQEELFNKKVSYYMSLGNTREKSEELTSQTINRPKTSEHNLGLAVDFNYVNNDFERTNEFKWLQENAQNYGFVLRYAKDKEKITKVNYEPWHWRYVGVDNAIKMKDLNMCLEEYLEYLKSN